MAAITTTGTLTAGNSRTFALAPGSALTLTLLPNCRVTVTETPETVSASDAGGNSPRTQNHQLAGVFTYGPYAMGGSVVVDNDSNSGSTVTWGRKDTTVSTSSDGLSLVYGDGNTVSVGGGGGAVVTAALLASNSAAANKAVLDAALVTLYALPNGGAGEVALPSGSFSIAGPILVTGKYFQESGGWSGGIRFKGEGLEATRLNFTTAQGFVVNSTGIASASSMVDFEDMAIVGPGKATSGGVGVDYGSQTATPVTSSRNSLCRVFLTGWETTIRMDDVTNIYLERCVFQNYVYALSFGYNVDIVTAVQCYFGSSTTPLGSKTETALYYNYHSLAFPTGALANNAHNFIGCWFMRQLVVADFYDVSIGNVKFDTSYIESSAQYAKVGNAGSSTGPKCLTWDNCHFSIPYEAGESAAKIALQNAAGDTSINILNCRSDSTNGPNGGWIDAGGSPGSTVIVRGSILPTGGAATTQAAIKYGTKLIVVPPLADYVFRSSTASGTDRRQFNGGASTVDSEVVAYGATSSTVFSRYAVKVTASEAEPSGNFPKVINQVLSGAHYVMWDGISRSAQGASLPTADAIFRGVKFLVQGGAGVADIAYECRKNSSDAYVWVVV